MDIILGIESSCDETSVAIYHSAQGLIAHEVYTQSIHTQYGGVVPELASRDHIRKLLPIVQSTLAKAGLVQSDLTGIAYTAGPGLAGALMVGAGFAVSLALALQIPVIPIHHLEAHILIAHLENTTLQFPFLAFLVSGGHTQLIHAHKLGHYEIIGDTLDDAIGEAFDKSAKVMGLPYPGGKEIAILATQGNPEAYSFPRPMLQHDNLDFSFSGLKTAVRQTWQNSAQTHKVQCDISASFQQAVIDTCAVKVSKALQQVPTDHFVLAGGVAANMELRKSLDNVARKNSAQLIVPRLAWCTDNGAMIAYAGYMHRHSACSAEHAIMHIKPRWPIHTLRNSD